MINKENSKIRSVDRNFQVTLPTEFLNRFNVQEGDLLEVIESEEGVIIRPVEIEFRRKQVIEALEESYKKLADNPYANLSEEHVMEMLNEARRQYREGKKVEIPTEPMSDT
ncbi:MAG: AbrB/MazE/SpoVT family DNA-binding domain-containing protein [Candidatus Magnetobacterium sp. LHC-1]|nr:AbrB/MazE/SpoVT family DNA-binding domain-containing protein [Nitrospirota bacterium]